MNFRPEKKLGFGLMRLPLNNKSDDADINIEEMKKMVDMFIERGFTYFDTAWMYNGFNSENAAKEALTSVTQEKAIPWQQSYMPDSLIHLKTEIRYLMSS